MREILFILLISVCNPVLSFQNVPLMKSEESGMVDEWISLQFEGDALYTVKCHYKAILFYNRESLGKYLKYNNADGSILIDVKKGKQYKIKQKEIKREVIKREKIFDYYEWELIDELNGILRIETKPNSAPCDLAR